MRLRAQAAALIVFAALILAPVAGRPAQLRGESGKFDEHALFRAVGEMYDLDPDLLEAMAEVESGGREDAVSQKGAVGLMQLMPSTAARFHVRDARDPVENVLGAARYLAHLRALYCGRDDARCDELSMILAAYDAGEGAVWRYAGLPPFAETQQYIGRVLWVYLTGSWPAKFPRSRVTAPRARKMSRRPDAEMEALEQLDSLRRARSADRDCGSIPH